MSSSCHPLRRTPETSCLRSNRSLPVSCRSFLLCPRTPLAGTATIGATTPEDSIGSQGYLKVHVPVLQVRPYAADIHYSPGKNGYAFVARKLSLFVEDGQPVPGARRLRRRCQRPRGPQPGLPLKAAAGCRLQHETSGLWRTNEERVGGAEGGYQSARVIRLSNYASSCLAQIYAAGTTNSLQSCTPYRTEPN